MPDKMTLRQWIAEGDLDRVTEELKRMAHQTHDTRFTNEVFQQTGRYNQLKREQLQGVLDDEDYRIQLNRITQALLDLIGRVPDTNMATPLPTMPPVAATPAEEPAPTLPEEMVEPPTAARQTPSNVPWIVGLGLLLLLVVLFLFYPQPSSEQFFLFRIVLALAAAGLVSVIPGILKLNWNNVVTGSGAVVAFLVVFFFNPPALSQADAPTQAPVAPFEFTIRLAPNDTLQLSPQYPPLDSAVLQIWLGNKWETAPVDVNHLADFKAIPGDFKDSTVAVQLKKPDTKYWTLTTDSVALRGKSQVLTIVPDGSLGRMRGRFYTSDASEFLPGVIVEIAGMRDTTDQYGAFDIQIPLEKQKIAQELIASKKRYALYKITVYPENGAMDLRLKRR